MSVEFSNLVGAPESLDLPFFQEVVENALLEACVVIKKVSIEGGSAGGDNYCSQIYRVRISYQRENESMENISIIVKSIPVTEGMQFLLDLKVFLKEKIFYNHMLPRMEILLDNAKLGGRLYHSTKEPINTLAFEDLSSSGYVMADRQTGLDLEHCLMVMKKIGQFHGVSMVLNKKDPHCMKAFDCGFLSEEGLNGSDMFVKLFKFSLDHLIKLVNTWDGYENITKKLENYSVNIKENLLKTQLPMPGELKVLNHGDLWVNNMLFKYKTNKSNTKKSVEDVVFVDFQMSVFGSPGLDLNYFLNTSVKLDVLKEKREELLSVYFNSLYETLKLHSYKDKDLPTFKDILKEVRQRESFGFFANFGVFPGISMDKSQSADNSLEKFLDKDFQEKKGEIIFSSQRLKETMRYTLKRFDEWGVLD